MLSAKKAILFCLFCSPLSAQEKNHLQTYIPSYVGNDLRVVHEGTDFYVINKNNERKEIPSWLIDKQLRNISKKQLELFSKNGYAKLNKCSNGDYSLKAYIKGKGGGPVLCGLFYWTVKGLGYGIPAVAATQLAIASLPTSLAIGVKGVAATEGLNFASGTVIGVATTGTLSGGAAGSVGGAVVVAKVGGPIVAMKGVQVTHIVTTGIGGYMGLVEAAAGWAGYIGLSIPWF